MHRIKTFYNTTEAHIYKAKLEHEGIPCFLANEHIANINPLWTNAVGGISIQVHEQNIERAKNILKEIENTPYTNDQGDTISCPNCASEHIENGYQQIDSMKSLCSFLLSISTLTYPLHYKSHFICTECKTVFDKKTY